MKIAVLSDIHGNMPALERVVEDLASRHVDRVINLGDNVSGPLWPKETLRFLMQQDWMQVRGNHDRQLAEQTPADMGPSDEFTLPLLNASDLQWLKQLPSSYVLEKQIYLCHGAPISDTTYLLDSVDGGKARLATPNEVMGRLEGNEMPVILCGHTHIPRIVTLGETMIVNPGSVGLQAYDDTVPEYHIMETGSPHTRYAILEKSTVGWRVEQIILPYDHAVAARQAQKNGRPDWEISLQSGYFNPA